jgi:hypothetical protein
MMTLESEDLPVLDHRLSPLKVTVTIPRVLSRESFPKKREVLFSCDFNRNSTSNRGGG